jgi:AAA15 family ATPase/GTPase
MIIKKVHIAKFRGFKDVEFEMGDQITVIAGQNGTQKTTLLGILSQTFSLRGHETMASAKPLCGGNYHSGFADKFKLSKTYDVANSHEWTLFLHNSEEPYIIKSIARDKASGDIRFWKKGDKSKGSGYIQLPVIYLSLKRLFPIGEDDKIQQSQNIELNADEIKIYQELHNEILISLDNIIKADYLESPNKNTLGVNTDYYDWVQNSAGQDNIGKIILAILSFRRLKNDFPNDYKGGIFVIDEIDATMYPASQNKLIEVLRKYSSKLSVQIIFTTHSLSLLETVCNLQKELSAKEITKNQVKVLFLEKKDKNINIITDVPFATIRNRLNVVVNRKNELKINVYTEDKEAAILAKKLLVGTKSNLKFIDVTIPCGTLIDLVYRKVPSFTFPNSIIILDGDVKTDTANKKKIKGSKNVLFLPTEKSPERIIANMLNDLNETDPLWSSINTDYTKQFCFKDYSFDRISHNREDAKKWFKLQQKELGNSWYTKTINRWKKDNSNEFNLFISDFTTVYNNFAKELSIDTI